MAPLRRGGDAVSLAFGICLMVLPATLVLVAVVITAEILRKDRP